MSVETDDRGRIYLTKELREKHGDRFRILSLPNRIVLIPIDDNPLQAIREAAGPVFADQTIEDLKADIIESVSEEIKSEVREREDPRQSTDS